MTLKNIGTWITKTHKITDDIRNKVQKILFYVIYFMVIWQLLAHVKNMTVNKVSYIKIPDTGCPSYSIKSHFQHIFLRLKFHLTTEFAEVTQKLFAVWDIL